MQLRASAPGSLMLLGEYGVLYGAHALACAVDKRIYVTLRPRLDNRVEIESVSLGRYAATLEELHQLTLPQLLAAEKFRYVLIVIMQQLPKLKHGFDVVIESEFSDVIGFGSSAAVTVATLATFITFFKVKITPLELIRRARQLIRQVQYGHGSGADVAAAVYGGIIGYRAQPLWVEKYEATHPIVACYAGYKTPTVQAIEFVQNRFTDKANLFRAIVDGIGECALEGIGAVRQSNWARLGLAMDIQQGMMDALGVNTHDLQDIVRSLRREPSMYGAKISGAGLGDCVIGLGTVQSHQVQHIPVAMTLQGVMCEKI